MKLLVIAGGGELPAEVVKGAKSLGYAVEVISFSDLDFDAELVHHLKIEEIPEAFRLIEKSDAEEAVMVGKVEHKIAFSSLMKHPSLLKFVSRFRGKNPMGILKAIGEMIEERGVKLESPLKFLPHLRFKKGVLTGKLSKEEEGEIARAFDIAKKIASMDIGLSIAWKEGAVIAVEAVEGTDEMIRRAGQLVSDFYLIKVARPGQDLRLDLPVIGLETLKNLRENGGSGLVFEAETTIFLQPERSLEFARKNGIKVISWKN